MIDLIVFWSLIYTSLFDHSSLFTNSTIACVQLHVLKILMRYLLVELTVLAASEANCSSKMLMSADGDLNIDSNNT